ncbi:MAG TPA: hypothetical protein VGL41_07775 [Roseiarcus sp.]|jgi:hypothetical protein
MRWPAASGLAILAILAAAGGCATKAASSNEETVGMQKSSSRIPAPNVPPVHDAGVRYEQVKNGFLAGFGQMGGYLAAYNEADGALLWTLKVYDNARDPQREGDVQDVFFKSMALRDDGSLLIENERGARFTVDPKARTSSPAP